MGLNHPYIVFLKSRTDSLTMMLMSRDDDDDSNDGANEDDDDNDFAYDGGDDDVNSHYVDDFNSIDLYYLQGEIYLWREK